MSSANVVNFLSTTLMPTGGGGGGGGYSGIEGAATTLRISRRKRSFWRPLHVRDLSKKGTFLYPGTKYGGRKSPYNQRNIRGSDAE